MLLGTAARSKSTLRSLGQAACRALRGFEGQGGDQLQQLSWEYGIGWEWDFLPIINVLLWGVPEKLLTLHLQGTQYGKTHPRVGVIEIFQTQGPIVPVIISTCKRRVTLFGKSRQACE